MHEDARSPILIVENNADDLQAINEILHCARIQNPLHCVATGNEAVLYLLGEGRYAKRFLYPYPVLLLLKLHLNEQHELDVLKRTSAAAHNRPVCIVIVANRGDILNIARAYRFGAHSFLTKPVAQEDFVNVVRGLKGIALKSSTNGLVLNVESRSS